MAKRSKKSRVPQAEVSSNQSESPVLSSSSPLFSASWLPLSLAAISFLIYWPSFASDFVYDARTEILKEGYITSLANLPDVLSLKVLGMNLMLGARPGQLLYLMLQAAVWGTDPWGYHLGSNLLHSTNVALLFVLLRRLVAAELPVLIQRERVKIPLAIATVTLLFALHPIAAEPVSSVSYSSDLLATFFTLLAVLSVTYFQPSGERSTWFPGIIGALSATAAVTCKESGLAAALLLIVYWFLFRRLEASKPWVIFSRIRSRPNRYVSDRSVRPRASWSN